MAYRLAVTEQLDALKAAEGKGTFWKQRSPINLDQVEIRAVLSSCLIWTDTSELQPRAIAVLTQGRPMWSFRCVVPAIQIARCSRLIAHEALLGLTFTARHDRRSARLYHARSGRFASGGDRRRGYIQRVAGAG